MTAKWNALLLAALIGSSLWLVKTSHESRRLFAALDRERSQAQALESERQRLEAERQAQATPLRVEHTARAKLAMRPATAAVTVYVQELAASGGKP
ncbi:MAG: cell division protein FtsL [Rubrivivax sp.]|nr:cell division protein FtsL [Rubrivivax sp.]MDH5339740.1 cell division protein FtsL [Rubrivivax sp.]